MNKKFTFKPPVIDNTHYFLGSSSVPKIILQPDGDWSAYLPDPEDQNRRGLETYDCTGFGTLNAIEILMYRLFGEKINYSDRWVGIIAGTGEGGNDPHTVCEAIRKYGLIPEEMLPFSDDIKTIDEYYSFKGADKEKCYEEGRKWLDKYDFKHEWVYSSNQPEDEKINNRKTSLKMSPLGISVYAWELDNSGVYVAPSEPNHWTTDTAYISECDVAFDSYIPYAKKVKQNISFCKRFYIAKKENSGVDNKWVVLDIFKKILEACKSLLQIDKQILDTKVVEKPPLKEVFPPDSLKPKYSWSTPEEARASTVLICSEKGLTKDETKLICQVINCESGFKINATNKNKDGTTDYGIIQANEYWYIGKGKPFATVDEALNNPEKGVRIMIQRYKEGGLSDWICYKNKLYKNY